MKRLKNLILIISLLLLPTTVVLAETSIISLEKKYQTYYIKNTNTLIDTGSGYSIVPEIPSDAIKIKDIIGILANGQELKTNVYKAPYLKIGTCELKDVQFVVFPRSNNKNIIGMSVLERLQPFTFDLTDPNNLKLIITCPNQDKDNNT